jgi:hypothetical protein
VRRPLAFDPGRGYPSGRRIVYECLDCGDNLPSLPAHAETCRCGNIAIDPDAGRISVKVPARMAVHETD